MSCNFLYLYYMNKIKQILRILYYIKYILLSNITLMNLWALEVSKNVDNLTM